jgi:5'(3')-deoxyribonucleotidase
MDKFSESFGSLKASRELVWCHQLGVVELEILIDGRSTSLQVNPIQASLILLFQTNCSTW